MFCGLWITCRGSEWELSHFNVLAINGSSVKQDLARQLAFCRCCGDDTRHQHRIVLEAEQETTACRESR